VEVSVLLEDEELLLPLAVEAAGASEVGAGSCEGSKGEVVLSPGDCILVAGVEEAWASL
jgi:hypothetical protein